MSTIHAKSRRNGISGLAATKEIARALAFIGSWEHVEIEIGSGNGHFLSEYGNKYRTHGFIGSELKKKRCGKILKKIEGKKLSNVLIFHGSAQFLFESLPPASVDAFHLYFPDPWPKAKHRKRRLFRMPVLSKFHLSLKEGGLIFFASDVFDYYIQAKLLGILHGGFELVEIAIPDEAVLSMYSKKTLSAGKPLKSFVLQKVTR